MLKIQLSKRSQTFLIKIPQKHSKQIAKKILQLQLEPMQNDAKKLQGQHQVFRVDSGEYRIIYSFNLELVEVLLIGKRNDGAVYREFARLI